MLNNLLNFINEASETELFPGLDTSVFDEHSKYKQSGPKLKALMKRLDMLEHQGKVAEKHASHILKMVKAGYDWEPSHPDHVALLDHPWIDKYPVAKDKLENVRVDKTAPYYNRLEKLIATYDLMMRRYQETPDLVKKLKSKIQRTRKKEADSIFDQADSIPKKNIESHSVPISIDITYRTEYGSTPRTDTVDNPYFDSTTKQYAGHPVHYPHWSKESRQIYSSLEMWARRLGYPSMSLLYASTIKGYNSRTFKYYIENSDRSLVAYYGYQSGSGQRHFIYVKHPKHLDLPLFRWRMRHLRPKDTTWIDKQIEEMYL